MKEGSGPGEIISRTAFFVSEYEAVILLSAVKGSFSRFSRKEAQISMFFMVTVFTWLRRAVSGGIHPPGCSVRAVVQLHVMGKQFFPNRIACRPVLSFPGRVPLRNQGVDLFLGQGDRS